jgi:hypothetical protein
MKRTLLESNRNSAALGVGPGFIGVTGVIGVIGVKGVIGVETEVGEYELL